MKRSFALALSLVLAAGCMSVPRPRYYTLDMTPSGKAVPKRCLIEVETFQATESVDREAILVKLSPTRAEYYALDLWIEGLDELVARKLLSEFEGAKKEEPVVLVRGKILAFEEVDRGDKTQAHVKLEVEFRIKALRKEIRSQERIYEATVKVEERNPDAVAKALSRGLEKIAVRIAADADSFASAQ